MTTKDIKALFRNKMRAYKVIAQRVSERRGEGLAWRTVQDYFRGHNKVVSDTTASMIIEEAKRYIREESAKAWEFANEE